MNYIKLFYWLTVADNCKLFFGWMIFFAMVAIIIGAIIAVNAWVKSPSSNQKVQNELKFGKKLFWRFTLVAIIFWSLYLFTPNKKDALFIIAGGQTLNYLTNDTTVQKIPSEVLNSVVSELKTMAAEIKVDLKIANQKDKILDQAKQMTTNELLERMQNDSTFARIILGK